MWSSGNGLAECAAEALLIKTSLPVRLKQIRLYFSADLSGSSASAEASRGFELSDRRCAYGSADPLLDERLRLSLIRPFEGRIKIVDDVFSVSFQEAWMTQPKLPISRPKLVEFCRRWKVAELALFGSVLRDDFRPDSDVDVLVSFTPDARWGLFDLVDMQEELKNLFGREVDLVEREGLRNPFRRRSILSSMQVVYGSQ
jgi:uncharacterized protein